MKFHVINLGCKVNKLESDQLTALFLARGAEISQLDDADLVVINTCTVTGEADKKARKATRSALRHNAAAQVVVTGCASALHPSEFSEIDARVQVIPKASLIDVLDNRYFSAERALDAPACPSSTPALARRVGEHFRTRVSIKIQDGCDHACTFCIVHVARGKARSRNAYDVIDEVLDYAQAGVREIVLTGINTGSYCYEGITLARLLEKLLDLTAHMHSAHQAPLRFRLSSVEPQNIDDALIDVMAQHEGRVCRHLHLPMQSGSTRILEAMERDYSIETYLDLVARLRAKMPSIALSTDVIVGFPGETDDDFDATVHAIRTAQFCKLHVFPYSVRAGTPAACMPHQVPEPLKRLRASMLRALSDQLFEADFNARIGTKELVLVENDTALTDSYHEIARPLHSNKGDLIPIVLREQYNKVPKNSYV